MNTRIEFEIVSETGELLYTSPHEDLARRWARRHAATYPGLRLERVERIEIRRKLWTDRANFAATVAQARAARTQPESMESAA